MRIEIFFLSLQEIIFIMLRRCYITTLCAKHHAEERCSGSCFSTFGVIGNQDVTTVYFC